MKKILIIVFLSLFALGSVTVLSVGIFIYAKYSAGLPDVSTIEDYDPKKVSMVYDRNGELIGQFFDVEKRRVRSEDEIPDFVEKAFMAAEDSEFYNHNGINYRAILRAAIKNFMAGRTVQGGSTITQQVVKKIFLSDERSIERKIKEAILAKRLERAYSKDKILNLYLNHIYLGEGAYGVEVAAQTYFRKSVEELEIKEAALLAGLTNRPGKNTPLKNPKAAKRRQLYVLGRMAEEGYITEEQAKTSAEEDLQVYFPRSLEKDAPYFLESLRQVVTENVGNKALLQDGLKIITSLDLEAQRAAQTAVQKGLRELDKRQGFRGPLKSLKTREEVQEFLYQERNEQIKKFNQSFTIDQNGEVIGKIKDPLNLTVYTIGSETEFKSNLPEYIKVGDIVNAVVTKVSDKEGLVFVRFGEHRGLILFDSMKWARKPNPDIMFKFDEIKKPSYALKKGDVIAVKVVKEAIDDEEVLTSDTVEFIERHAVVELEQEPLVQGALLSFDLKTGDIIAMVGGYDFSESKYNRTYQSLRQTGSAFKPLVYASALDYGFNPVSEILDVPMVFEEEVPVEESQEGAIGAEDSKEVQVKKYKPANHSKDFSGDVIFRDALVRSLNVPTMQIINKIKVPWALTYAQRLGVFSPLNEDITLALGSSGLTLYEMTKVYSHFARLGKEITPLLIRSVENEEGEILMSNYSFDNKFAEEIKRAKAEFNKKVIEEMRFGDQMEVFQISASEAESQRNSSSQVENAVVNDPNSEPEQLISPQTAYIMTNILSDVIYGSRGTGARARSLRRPAAGKTGSTSDYFDAWFMGYTAQIATGVWVGFDQEKTLGRGEVGGRSALPIWTEYMKEAHKKLPKEDFKVPEGIIFTNIDADTGKLVGPNTERVAKQAFKENFVLEKAEVLEETVDERDLFEEDFE
jgi:penicillin-binding protein 1A